MKQANHVCKKTKNHKETKLGFKYSNAKNTYKNTDGNKYNDSEIYKYERKLTVVLIIVHNYEK